MGKNYFVKGLAHIGIFTDDPEGCVKFYVDNLGFHPYHSSDRGDFKICFAENSGSILEFVGRGARMPEEGRDIVDHIAIEVAGIEALVEELKEKGIIDKEKEITYMPDLFPSGVKNIFFKGPAGERIELFDYTNSKVR